MLSLRLLGPIEIRVGTVRLDAPGRDKGLVLLAYLAATAGRSHAREDIAATFWPAMAREQALHNLRQTLLRLRGLLSRSSRARCFLTAGAHSVVFESGADHWLDLEPFLENAGDDSVQSLERRAVLYRGPFMEDVACPISERFADWLALRRDDCQRRALAHEGALASRHEYAGRLDRAVEHARRAVALEPWNEAGQRRLLRLLTLAGQPEAALSHFEALRADLRRELGADAQDATLALAGRIRDGALAPALTASQPQERRQVVMLDCRLSWDGRADPEASMALMASLRAAVARAHDLLLLHGGSVYRHGPETVTACFGWPAADERAARHAARAALALHRDLARVHPQLRVAIGIHGGWMLDSEAANGGAEVAEQALRMRLSATDGTTLVSAPMHRRLRAHFDLRPLPGGSQRTNAWQLTGEREHGSRWVGDDTHPFVGRAAQLARMLDIRSEARDAGLRVVALTGDAGVGKSRLVREFLRAAGIDSSAVGWCECDPRASSIPLDPLLRMLRQRLPAPAGLGEIRACMSALPGSRDDDTAALLAPLFALDDRVPTSQLAIPLPRARLLEALGRLLARMLGNATALVVEDLHWADPSTLEVLDELAHRHAELRIPIVLTARVMPPLAPRLRDRIEAIELAPLDEATAAKLADAIVASRDDDARRETCAEPRAERTTRDADAVIDAQAIREMLRVAEGIPLFIVEQARSLSARATGHRAAVADGLQDLLAARLDEAGADKALLQAAAVIGVEFTRARLRGLTGGTGGPIDEAIDRLTKVSLLEAGVRGASEARFSHALLQRAALESLPRGRRSDLHRRYAALLQDDAKSGLEAPDAIAWHLHEGGLPAEAARWWLRAARRAVRQAAYAEAAGLAERALAALETTPDRGAFDDVAFAALLLGAYAYVALGGYYDARAQQWYERAYRLTRRPDADPRKLLGALRGHWVGASSRASHREAKAIAGQMIGIARAAGLAWLHGVACYLAGNSALWLGEFDAAFALLNEAVDVLRRAPRDADALLAHEQDFEVTATGYLAWAHWYLGRTELALELGRRALQRAQESADVPTWLHTAVTFCSIAMGARKPAEVMEISAQIVDRALRHELAMWADIGRLQHHWARACLGDETHTGLAVDALERLCTNYPGGAAGFQCILAESFLFLGDDQRVHRALAALRDSLQQTEAGAFSATLHRLEGELATREGRSRDAGAAFHRAVELAIAQGSPALEAQARTAQIGAEPSVAIWS